MTSEHIREQRLTGKGDTQKIRVSSALRNGQGSTQRNGRESPVTVQSQETPIDPPRDPIKRREFWLDTCRGFAHVKFACAQIQELYRKQGCRFAEPTVEQICGVLDALDGAMPNWEREHPELFYQTLELSFPELVIHR